jgi:putative FmdB family regulatory protein
MPIYEYVCEKCGALNEVIQKVDDPPPAACEKCGSKKLSRQVSRSSFQLKGGGWYSEGYSSGGSAKKESKSSSSSTSKDSKKSSDSK